MKPVKLRPAAGTAVVGLLLGIVGTADYLSGPDITFSLFYLIIIALVAWTVDDQRVGLGSAIVSGIVWLVAEWFTVGAPRTGVLLWNAGTRLAILLTIAVLISRLKLALEAEKASARTDFLTGVLNGRAFAELAAAEVARARRFAHPLTIAYIDVDDFKGINDRMGHSHGDEVLRKVGTTLRSSLRETDVVARVGGDEFVLLLAETARDEAEIVVGKVQRALLGALASNESPITFSVGVAAYATPPVDVDVLISRADALMYRAKAAGKNRIELDSAAGDS